jgi:hypothetical protein
MARSRIFFQRRHQLLNDHLFGTDTGFSILRLFQQNGTDIFLICACIHNGGILLAGVEDLFERGMHFLPDG